MQPQSNRIFTFDESQHKYYLDGEEIPSFSEIMRANGLVDFSNVDPQVLERSRIFGTNMHKAIKLLNEKKIDIAALDPALLSGCDKWLRFLDMTGYVPVVKWGEQPICSELYRYGCTPDWLLVKDNKYAVADLKTSTGMQPYMQLQTAAQKIAIQEFYGIKVSERLCLQIPLEGEAVIKPHKDKRDEAFFLNALGMYKFKKETGIWKAQ